MTAPSLILGTAGHIDHGKSTLIEALTGTDPDRLAEEKRRGITIELGFAQLTLPDGRVMGVVDVPGHERFVRQMISGATGIDVALMCIAADDGIMPQTIEHLHVLELLGVQTMVVALTKADLVDEEWLTFMEDEVRARLQGTPYEDAPIVAVSARERTGLDRLLDAIAQAASHTASTHGAARDPARLPIDRSFTIKGSGTVVTGTLWSGTVAVDDELELLPAGARVRVRSVQEHGAPVDAAQPGTRTALNLAGISTDEARPGMFLASPGSVTPTDRFDAQLTYLGSQERPAPLATGARVRVAHGTAEVPGRVLLMDGDAELEPGASALAQIRLDEPLPATRGDRFVVRTVSPVEVVGGGRILLAHPRRRTNLSPAERSLLEALREGDDASAVRSAIEEQAAPATADRIAAACELPKGTCEKELDRLAASGDARRLGGGSGKPPLYGMPSVIASLESALESALARFHVEHPDKTGVGKAELARLVGRRIDADAFDALLAELAAQGRALLDGGMVCHPKAGAGARRQEEQAAETLQARLGEASLKPPTISALAKECGIAEQLAHRALGALEQKGLAFRIGEYYFDADALAAARSTVESFIEAHGPSSAADLKDALGVSRKHAIPLLEYFDAKGVTRRESDLRALNH